MPNRILKESICESEGLSGCTIFARDLYARLITYADDYGRFNADTQIMLARLYPREMDCIDQFDIVEALTELVGVGKIAFYTSSPRKTVYGCFPNWKDHQRVRDSKKRFPDPDDTTVNDWYLQRFIPIDLKVEIIERDGFKCQVCGKFITSDKDARRLAKHGCGMYHIDHIVPVNQGGRATLENLRLTCPTCNLKRKRKYTFKEIVDFAASRGESRQVAASSCRNPIQSESNPNPTSNPKAHARDGGDSGLEAPELQENPYGFSDASGERPDFGTIEAYASSNLRSLSMGNMQELVSFKDDFPDEVIRLAIDQACGANAPVWNYVRKVLNNWLDKGIKTAADAKADIARGKQQANPPEMEREIKWAR